MPKPKIPLWNQMSPAERKGAADFARRMANLAEEVEENINDGLKEISAVALTEIVYQTPVDRRKNAPHPGQARGGWVVGANTPPVPREPGHMDEVGTDTIAEGIAELTTLYGHNNTVFIENHVPYINKLNAGSSQQAPAGFVEKALVQARSRFGTFVFKRRSG